MNTSSNTPTHPPTKEVLCGVGTQPLCMEVTLNANNHWVTPYEVGTPEWWDDARVYSRRNYFVSQWGVNELPRLRFALDDLRVGLKIQDVNLALDVLNILGGWNDRCYEIVGGQKKRTRWSTQNILEQWDFVNNPSYRPFPLYCLVRKTKTDRREQEIVLTRLFIATCLTSTPGSWVSGMELYEGFQTFVPDFNWSYQAFLTSIRKQNFLSSVRTLKGNRVGFSGISVENVEPLYVDTAYAYRPKKYSSRAGKVRAYNQTRFTERVARQSELRDKVRALLDEMAECVPGIRAQKRFPVECLMARLGPDCSRKMVGVILTSLGMSCDRNSRIHDWMAKPI